MLVKDENSSELYIHICPDANKYTRKALKKRITIYRHDVMAFIVTESGKLEPIKYCPYCGMDVENESEVIK